MEILSAYKAIMGSVYPNHCISIEGKTKDDIESLLKGLNMALEVKAAIILFQNCPKGISPTVVIAARPQSNNETSSFTRLIETACVAGAAKAGAHFLGFAVDGISLESMDVHRAICDFIAFRSFRAKITAKQGEKLPGQSGVHCQPSRAIVQQSDPPQRLYYYL